MTTFRGEVDEAVRKFGVDLSKIYEKYRVSHSQVKVQLAIPTFTLEGEVGAWSWQYYSLPSKFWTWGASTTKWTLAILFVLFALFICGIIIYQVRDNH